MQAKKEAALEAANRFRRKIMTEPSVLADRMFWIEMQGKEYQIHYQAGVYRTNVVFSELTPSQRVISSLSVFYLENYQGGLARTEIRTLGYTEQLEYMLAQLTDQIVWQLMAQKTINLDRWLKNKKPAPHQHFINELLDKANDYKRLAEMFGDAKYKRRVNRIYQHLAYFSAQHAPSPYRVP